MKNREPKQIRFEKFMKKLAYLSFKYGVDVHSTGGVYILNEKEFKKIKKVEYDCDYTSGDLKIETILKN